MNRRRVLCALTGGVAALAGCGNGRSASGYPGDFQHIDEHTDPLRTAALRGEFEEERFVFEGTIRNAGDQDWRIEIQSVLLLDEEGYILEILASAGPTVTVPAGGRLTVEETAISVTGYPDESKIASFTVTYDHESG